MGFRGFFVLIFVEALHGPLSFIIVDVRDCKHVSAKLPPSLFTRASTNIDLSCMLAVVIGLARVNNWPECITFFAIHGFGIGLILNYFIYLPFSLLGIICK